MSEQANGHPDRGARGQFVKGHKGRGGRPANTPTKFGQRFREDMDKVWAKRGRKALNNIDDKELVKAAIQLYPKQVEIEAKFQIEQQTKISLEVSNFIDAWKIVGAEPPKLIEAQAIEVEDERADS